MKKKKKNKKAKIKRTRKSQKTKKASSKKKRILRLSKKAKQIKSKKSLKRKSRPKNKKTAKSRKIVTKEKGVLGQIPKIKVKVVGIGGGGSSIVSEVAQKIKKFDFVAANTDLQALSNCPKGIKRVWFGQELTQGLGTGMNPEIAKQAAEKEKEKIAKIFSGTDFSILIGALGGGTASGASSLFANLAQKAGSLTLGIFTLPFKFEGQRKLKIARDALEELKPNFNALVIISNEKIFEIIIKKEISFKKALSHVNENIANGLGGLIEMIYSPGLINIDFADIKTILQGRGKTAYLNTAEAKGPNRIEEAIKKVLQNPLYQYDISGAERILFNITSGKDLKMCEAEEISRIISGFSPRAKIIFGVSQNSKYNNKVKITLLAVGCGDNRDKTEARLKKTNKRIKKKQEAPAKPAEPTPVVSTDAKKGTEGKSLVNKSGSDELPLDTTKKEQPKLLAKPKPKSKPKPRQKPKAKTKPKTEKVLEVKENKTRRNALEIKKTEKAIENEKLLQEKEWEIPTFLRRSK